MKKRKSAKRKYPKMSRKTQKRAGKLIAEEFRAGRRGRQAVAIGLSRERSLEEKERLHRVIGKYL